MEILVLSSAAAAGVLLLAFKLGIRKLLAHEALLDLLVTGLLMVSLYGTMTGMTIALTAGLITSVSLMGMKKLIGYEKLTRVKTSLGKTKWKWVKHQGILS